MKRILAIFLCFSVLSVVFTVNAETSAKPVIVCESVTAAPGEQFTVKVELKNNPGIAYLEMTPVYSDGLTLVNAVNGNLFTDLTKGKQYVWISDEDITGNGILLTFTFITDEKTAEGEYNVGFIFRYCTNYSESPIEVAVTGGKVTLSDAAPVMTGDADGNGTIDTADATAILRYIIHEGNIIETASDCDGNGTIDTADATAILRYIIHEYTFPK